MSDFDDIYEQWIDEIISIPLTTRPYVNQDIEHALRLNTQIINNVFNLRRNLELTSRPVYHSRYLSNDFISYVQEVFDVFLDMEDNSQGLEDVKVIVSEDDFERLKTINFTEENKVLYKDKDCNICIENYNQNESIKVLPCGHLFHLDCIKNWLCNEKVNCPVCRKDVREG